MSYFTLKSGEKLYYEDKGNGSETLIMMHGWTSSHEIYLKPVETLQKYARCIIYDHRGHGMSKEANSGKPTMETLAGDLNELIQGLSLSNVTLLGWSMGAGVVLNYVRLYGCDKLKQIVLCDMTPKQLARSAAMSGTEVPQRFRAIVDFFGDDPDACRQAGIIYATEQIVDLIANGIRHIHVYTMNKPQVAEGIMNNLSAILK